MTGEYLHFHQGSYRVRVLVPERLVAEFDGKRLLLWETGETDRDRAKRVAAPQIKKFHKMLDEAALRNGKPRRRSASRAASSAMFLRGVSDATTTTEWYMPRDFFPTYFPGIRFDLDVAAPPGGLQWIPADHHYCLADDGLVMPWFGFVWCNPPFGVRNGMLRWFERFVAHNNGLFFTAGNSYTRWYLDMAQRTDARLSITGYVNMVDGRDMERKTGASFGSCIFACGDRGVAALELAKTNGLGLLDRR
jgi:hypothetical protein